MKHPKSNFVFSQVPSVVRPRSTFDRSRYYKSAFDAGKLIPFFLDEVLPGDTFTLNTTAFARLSTLVTPFMDNLYLDFFFFYVPNRLVWENWERFCGAQDNPDDSTDYLVPQVHVMDTSVGSIYDYFGLPVGHEMSVSALPFRSYALIWNEFFRDENLQDSVTLSTGDGPDSGDDYSLLYRGKRKSDPFTSALPWPQKGPGVEINVSGTAPIGAINNDNVFSPVGFGYMASGKTSIDARNVIGRIEANSGVSSYVSNGIFVGSLPQGSGVFSTASVTGDSSHKTLPLFADLSQTSAVTINSLREAFQIQKWYEQLARGGSRYLELCLSMFGTHTGDARLQRPEYLGGGSTPIQIHSVTQASATDEVSPQGNLAGYGIAASTGIGFSKSFVEHGHIIGLVSVRGDYGYQQGIDRMWSRQTKFDFYWPAFAHLGEVPIKNKEIYYTGDSEFDDAAFGYQERWYEYRYGVNKITGKLRSGVSGSLDVWHLAQHFSNAPALNSEFITEAPPVSRVLAVQNEPQFIFDSVTKCRCARVMPVYSVPGLVDHF